MHRRWGRVSLAFVLLLTCSTSSLVWADEEVPTAREARRILRAPSGSLSYGLTNNGSLRNGVEMPLRGTGYAFQSVIERRKTNFGTRELIQTLERAARLVRQEFPGSVLSIGNIGFEEGGRITWSVSHQSGRDVDLGFFAIDRRGRPVNLRSFVSFWENGKDRAGRYTFDAERNLAVVEALMSDSRVQVQWIFVADWLKERLIARAWEEGLDEAFIAKLDIVLRQPSDSNPHHHHFHVRLYCSSDDRRHGCLERGDVWDWIDLDDPAFEAYVAQVVRILKMPRAVWRRRAAEKLEEIRAYPAVPHLLESLKDTAPSVRRAALSALRAIREPSSAGGLLAALSTESDSRFAGAIARVLLLLNVEESQILARQLVENPAAVVSEDVVSGALPAFHRAAADYLSWRRSAASAPLLRRLLESDESRVRKSANEALERLTNHRLGSRRGRTPSASVLTARWNRFFESMPEADWLTWVRQGFAEAGYDVGNEPLSWHSVEMLIGALRDSNGTVAQNASLVLSWFTGFEVDPRARSPRNNQRLWRRWIDVLVDWKGGLSESRSPRRAPESRIIPSP